MFITVNRGTVRSALQLKCGLDRQFRAIHTAPNDVLDYDLFTPKNTELSNDNTIPPMIFLHGFLGNRRNNRSAAKLLAEQLGTPFIVPDLRNHGTSFHSTKMNYKELSNDLSKLIENLPASVPTDRGFLIMGHSMGGKAAMIHALRYPELIKGVISIDNVPYNNPEDSLIEFEKFHMALQTLQECIANHSDWSIVQLKQYLKKWLEPSEQIVNFWLTNVLVNKEGHLSSRIPLDVLNNSIENILQWKMEEFGDLEPFVEQQNVAPLMIIRANYSKFVGKDIHTHAISKYFPKYEINSIDASHWLVTEKKMEFVKIVKEWALRNYARQSPVKAE